MRNNNANNCIQTPFKFILHNPCVFPGISRPCGLKRSRAFVSERAVTFGMSNSYFSKHRPIGDTLCVCNASLSLGHAADQPRHLQTVGVCACAVAILQFQVRSLQIITKVSNSGHRHHHAILGLSWNSSVRCELKVTLCVIAMQRTRWYWCCYLQRFTHMPSRIRNLPCRKPFSVYVVFTEISITTQTNWKWQHV